jgi:hypothetical protein
MILMLCGVHITTNFRHILTEEIACNAGVEATKEITVVDRVKHGEYYVEAVWPLGSAIEAVSTKKWRQDA